MEPSMQHHMDYGRENIIARNVFNLDLPEGVLLAGMKAGNPFAPAIKPDYVFSYDRFRDIYTFWILGLRALKIIGDPAAGKTSVIEQWHARLGLPLFIMGCHENMTETDFLGQFVPQANGTLKWVDAPVMSVFRHGGSVLLDEWNNLNPNAATTLNAMLEGYTISIPQTGEVIKPHPEARFFATQNPVDGKTAVQGRYVQDTASDDRFMEMWVDYLEPALETKIVKSAMLKINSAMSHEVAQQTASGLVEVANEIRKNFRTNHLAVNQDFHKPMSTRVLVRWAQLTLGFQNVTAVPPIIYAMERAFSGITHDMRVAVEKVIKDKLGLTRPNAN